MKDSVKLGLILVVLATLVGCAPGQGEVTPEGAAPTVESVELNETPAGQATATAALDPTAEPTKETVLETPAGGVIARAMTSEPGPIDPQGAPGSGSSLVLPYLFDTLVVRDADGAVSPLLAESWQVADDGLSVTFVLKGGVLFHDGTPLNAQAVQSTFERFMRSGQASPIYSTVTQISGVEAIDDLTVRFTFDEPAANFFSTISMPYAGIISPQSVAELGEDGSGNLVGSGPFMLGEWMAGQSLTLVRNPDYAWGPSFVANQGAPYLDELVYQVIPDASTQLAAFQSGEVNVFFINEPSHREQLEQDPSVELQEAVLGDLVYLGFNCQKSPFDETLVRQALSHAINKVEIVDLALGGIGQPAFAPLPPTIPGFDASLAAYELGFDLETAEALLSEAGFIRTDDGNWERDGALLQGVLLTSTRPPNDDIATLIQAQLKVLGVPVEIQQLDTRAVSQATAEGTFDLLLYRYSWNDPDALDIFLSTERIGRTNRVAYSNSDVDALLEQGAHELDQEARLAYYIEAQKLILEDAPWQPLYYPVNVMAMNASVHDAKVGYMGRLVLNDAWTGEP